ncbi:MAG TPA: multicopper oxidase domain-containing protein [Steroidobacteraceae bacterium]|nr:multicopper oxidase domain-containing protein [Steroidobacteraceae bacterium]
MQCPTSTLTHPTAPDADPAYTGPTYVPTDPTKPADYTAGKTGPMNGTIKCQQIAGGDGYATMGDGTQTYLFAFGPLSGIANISQGLPGTVVASEFNTPIADPSVLVPGYPAAATGTIYNGAIGLVKNNVAYTSNIYSIFEGSSAAAGVTAGAHTVTVVQNSPVFFKIGDSVVIGQGTGTDLAGYVGTHTVTAIGIANNYLPASFAFQYTLSSPTGLAEVTESPDGTASSVPTTDGHVDARQVMDVGVMNGNIPAPMMAMDEDDEFFLTLTNVGMIMRPDLFEQHTVHFHGYPNASSLFDGVPDASVAINIGGSFTYYYLAPDAGTYFYHCHITPPEHLQMGMVGQLYVRPRQNRWTGDLWTGLQVQQGDLRTKCDKSDVLCSNPLPPADNLAANDGSKKYVYNDGDGVSQYDVEYPVQMHGFDPNFHFVGMTFNPEGFADMKDKYFLLNGRSYPDTVSDSGPIATQSADGVNHFAQPLNSIINITHGQKALLRLSDLGVSEYHTLASLGIRMHVVGWNAKLLRDQLGNDMDYYTNSITLGGGESADVILDASDPAYATCGGTNPACVFYLYTSNLDHLSNDAENFGGQMTEVRIN